MPTQTDPTYKYDVEDGVKCGGCNWEVYALYVMASTKEDADRLLHAAYGCAHPECGILQWEHGRLLGFQGEDRETATPIWQGPHLDHDFEDQTEMVGAGLCGECYAAMLAVTE